MYLLTEAEISHLNKFGYVVCETGLEGSQVLLDAQRQYKKLYKLTEDGGYPYFRIYFDYSGKKNISGIEMPFHPEIINKEIVAFLNASNLILRAFTVGIHIMIFNPCCAAHSIDLIPSTT